MDAEQHPVIRALRRSDILAPRFIDYLVEHGRSFEGVPLPEGIERWPMGTCVEASAAMLKHKGWRRVQGWSIAPKALTGDFRPVYHEWNTIDGETALDVSVPNPPQFLYFGVPYADHGRADMMVVGEPVKRKPMIPLDLVPGSFARSLERSFRLF